MIHMIQSLFSWQEWIELAWILTAGIVFAVICEIKDRKRKGGDKR